MPTVVINCEAIVNKVFVFVIKTYRHNSIVRDNLSSVWTTYYLLRNSSDEQGEEKIAISKWRDKVVRLNAIDNYMRK